MYTKLFKSSNEFHDQHNIHQGVITDDGKDHNWLNIACLPCMTIRALLLGN